MCKCCQAPIEPPKVKKGAKQEERTKAEQTQRAENGDADEDRGSLHGEVQLTWQ